jgi:molybdopterin synthase catalytic subunit
MLVPITVTSTTVKLLPNPASKIRLAQITTSAINPETLRRAIGDPAGGAIALFVGVVRNQDAGREVSALSYSAHPSAQGRLLAILEGYAVEHRVGELQVGDVAVVCGVTSAHRDVAFSVCSALIEEVKAQVPIWKNETFKDGSNVWIGVS